MVEYLLIEPSSWPNDQNIPPISSFYGCWWCFGQSIQNTAKTPQLAIGGLLDTNLAWNLPTVLAQTEPSPAGSSSGFIDGGSAQAVYRVPSRASDPGFLNRFTKPTSF